MGWRQMTLDDLKSVMEIADKVHPNLPESEHVFAERVTTFPEGCLVLLDNEKETLIVGYTISHPIRHRQPPALDGPMLKGRLDPLAVDQYYIHDLAILRDWRGFGFATEGLAVIAKVADRYPTTCLISVYGTEPFWRLFGFQQPPGGIDAALSDKVKGYGEDAVFLEGRAFGEASMTSSIFNINNKKYYH
ncbi:hypothetical protein B0H63DRAFT_474301 [Podospora didyma]|uniref:N-acetyltransferase domain-containing protein n=1 Tax=Podospora didyma TaxID=330526 RepID=A0AAE0U0J0_9PEZI|nr:hypothetical protein B0H63DRAFT_474301 [Podospora didyma]